MRAQIRAVGESAMAMIAAEGLLARVRPDVALQKPRPGESLAAEMALAGQRVGSDMHLEGASRRVNFATFLARDDFWSFLFARLDAVELLVLN